MQSAVARVGKIHLRLTGMALVVLAMLIFFAQPAYAADPTFGAMTATRTLPENSVASVAVTGGAITATDADIGDTLTYSLTGSDDDDTFEIDSSTGQLSTKSGVTHDFDFESSKKTYTVTVSVTDSVPDETVDDTITVTINLTNVDEPGTVTISGTPEVGQTITGSVTDPDGSVTVQHWQWMSGDSQSGTFSLPAGTVNNVNNFTLNVSYVGKYIRLTATYSDALGEKTVPSNVIGPVVRGNAEPTFSSDTATRTLPENSGAGTNVSGGTITATDSDGDTLYYPLTGTDAGSFDIDANGQLSASGSTAFDFEGAKNSYTVIVNVSDRKDAAGDADTAVDDSITVTINLTNVDEPGAVSISGTLEGGSTLTASVTDLDGTPTGVTWQWARRDSLSEASSNISGATSASYTLVAADVGKYLNAFARYTDPQGSGKLSIAVTSGRVGASNADPTFSSATATRTLPENSVSGTNVSGGAITATDSDGDTLTYSLTGTDAGFFQINASGQLSISGSRTLNFEAAKNSYTVIVNVSDRKDAAGGANTVIDDSITVTINLTNVDEPGTVSISGTLEGGSTLTASVTDLDGTPTGVTWQWSRGNTAGGAFANIISATSASYMLVAGDVGKYLRATASYTDPEGSGKSASGTSGAVGASNAEPAFSSDTATRTLPENSGAGTNVAGGRVTATDSDGDTLTYLLTGTDAGFFQINASGQLSASGSTAFDFEATKNSYTVIVNVSDHKDSAGNALDVFDDSITVTINLTNVDEPGTVSISGTLSGGSTLTASVTDIDGAPSSVSWRWARGNTAGGSFSNISGANSASYRLVAADVGKYLRATASYTDPQGSGKTANAVTSDAAVASNTDPTFGDDMVTFTVPENSFENFLVGDLLATDSDGDVLRFELTGSDAGSFFVIHTGGLYVGFNANLDFESNKKSYTFTATVRDSKDAAGDANSVTDDTIMVTVTLTNVNEAPVITAFSDNLSIVENIVTDLSFFTRLTATDVDDPDTGTWSVETADDGDKFMIGADDGSFGFIAAPDFEMPDQAGSTPNLYRVTVKFTDAGGLADTHTLTVNVMNVNEAPRITTVDEDYTVLKADENTATTEVIETYEASDVDANSVLTWSLEGNDRLDFTITKNAQGHGELRFANVPNYEMPADSDTDNTYEVTVKVRDNHTGQLSDTLMVELDLNNVNETPVVSGAAGPSFAEIEFDVLEADLTPANYEIGAYTATDEDEGDTWTWSVSGTDSSVFEIDGTTGVLSFATRPDFENPVDVADAMNMGASDNMYVIVVEATDESDAVGTFDVTVTVTQVDETPEVTSGSATQSFTEIEYDVLDANLTSAHYVVDTFTARDEEGQTITWSLAGADMGDFDIGSSSGVLSFSGRPDFEMPADSEGDNVYNVIVKARDTSNNTRNFPVVVTVTDTNERPDINEDTVPSYVEIEYDFTGARPDVHTFSATDYDAGDSFTWSLLGTDAGDLEIDPSSGVLTFRQVPSLDVGPLPTFEAPQDDNADGSNTYNITVAASDNHGKIAAYSVVVTVTNVNERPELTGTPTAAVSYDENAVMDVATYTARDEEGGTLNWSLTGADGGRFTISPQGVVTFNSNTFPHGPNFEDPKDNGEDSGYNFTVVVTDTQSGSSRRTAEIDVTVTVNDLEEEGVITVSNLDPVVGEPIVFSLTDDDGIVTEDADGIVRMSWIIQRRASETAPWMQYSNERLDTTGSITYTALEDHTGNQIRVTVTYQDRRGAGKEATSASTAAITADPITNAKPRFLSFSFPSVFEGASSGNIGGPVKTKDRERDSLIFAIDEGSEYFAINSDGQVRIIQELDFEPTLGLVPVEITIHDGKDAEGNPSTEVDARTTYIVPVIDKEEPGVITLSADSPEIGGGAAGDSRRRRRLGQRRDVAVGAVGEPADRVRQHLGSDFEQLHAPRGRRGRLPAGHRHLHGQPRPEQGCGSGHFGGLWALRTAAPHSRSRRTASARCRRTPGRARISALPWPRWTRRATG